MYYTLHDLENVDIQESALESYKTMNVTWENVEKITRDYSDKIDIENNLKKVIELETEFLDKLNEFYMLIKNDNLSTVDLIVKKHIPTVILVISATLTCFGASSVETTDDDKAKAIMSSVGIAGGIAGITMKVKNSSAINFKKNSLAAIDDIIKKLKTDISINQKLMSINIKSKTQASKCNINIGKDGKIEVYRKYE